MIKLKYLQHQVNNIQHIDLDIFRKINQITSQVNLQSNAIQILSYQKVFTSPTYDSRIAIVYIYNTLKITFIRSVARYHNSMYSHIDIYVQLISAQK